MKKLLLLLNCTLCFAFYSLAQSAIGSWQTHISYTNISQITQSQEKIYGISTGALFSVDKRDNIVETYSKISGLNDNNIHKIEYSDFNDILFIAYQNSNIDLMSENGSIINISDIYRKNMSGSKQINNISFHNNLAYIACDFGITILNLDKKEFAETYIISNDDYTERTIKTNIFNNHIYALTENNILIGNTSQNLINYQNWNRISNPDSTQKNINMYLIQDTIYLLKTDNILYKYANNTWSKYKSAVKDISMSNDAIFLTDTANQITMIYNQKENIIAEEAISALFDENKNTIWFFSSYALTSKNLKTNKYNHFVPNGPESNTSWRLKYSNGRIFSIPGGRWAVNYYTPASLSIYENNSWKKYDTYYFVSRTETTDRSYDLVDIAINPNDNTNFWIASYGLGLYEFRNDELYKFHHCDNSGLTTIFPDGNKYNYIRTDGITYDDKGNLWMLNNAGNLIKYIDPNGVYHEIPNDIIVSHNDLTPQDIIISDKNPNQKIFLMPRYRNTNNSIFYTLDDNGTLNYTGDDKTAAFTKVFDQDNKELSFSASPLLRSIAQDKNGVIWVGTTKGVFLINDPSKMFDDNFRVYRIKIPRNDGTGLADYLLDTEEVKAIAVDGANRKWIGTASSGLYLVSENGLEIISHFTTENSPLLSNAIQSIAINEKTGEVFIGTGNGLISYQSDAIEGSDIFENIRAYPNPVRPEYTGLITIIGLIADTQIRITDVNGNVVYETRSNGGVATWDGCNASGNRVATGVYFAHCLSTDGKQKHIVKILIVK